MDFFEAMPPDVRAWAYFLIGGVLFLLIGNWFSSGANKRGPSCGFLFVAAILLAVLAVGLRAASQIGQ